MGFARTACLLAAALGLAGCISIPKFTPGTETDLERVERTLALNAGNVHAWFLKGKARLDTGELSEAADCFRRAIQLDADFEEAYEGLAVSYLSREMWEDAERTYSDLLKRHADSVVAFEGLATTALQQRDMDAAESNAKQAVARDAKSPQAHRILGEVAYIRGDYAGAVRHWEAAIASGRFSNELGPIVSDLKGFLERRGPAREVPAASP